MFATGKCFRCDVGDDEGCKSCEDDCVCSEGQWYGLVKTPIPGFVEAYKFDEGGNVSAVLGRQLHRVG